MKYYFISIVLLLLINSHIATAQKSATVILPGNYPDPSITCVNNEYYLVNSTGLDIPGLLIWHSSNLQDWNRIGYALTTKVGDIWAPDISYYNGSWYIYFTALIEKESRRSGNFVIMADSPQGPWSDPVKLNVKGIDPGHITTPEGKRYLFMSGGTIAELDRSGTKVIGEQKLAYIPWLIPKDYVIQSESPEGPKPVYYNGYYYLLLAQGGTSGPSTSHMVTTLRSVNIEGPWEHSPYNPIIRTKDKSERWWSTGHGTLLQGNNGNWYIVFHGYENSYSNLGRQVLITPVEWTTDGWFIEAKSTEFKDNIGDDFVDEFDTESLDFRWAFIDDSVTARAVINNGQLFLHSEIEGNAITKPLVINTENYKYSIITKVTINEGVTAGLVLYYNNDAYLGIALSPDRIIQFAQGREVRSVKLDTKYLSIHLKIINDRNDVSFYYSMDGNDWIKMERSYEVSGFNTNTLGGYRSLRAGIFANGASGASFDYFKYLKFD